MAEVPLGDYSVVVPDDLVADQQPAPSGSTGPTQTDAGNPWGLDPSVYAQLTGSPASVATAPQQPAQSAAPPDDSASQLGQAIAPSAAGGAAAPASALAGAGAAAPPDVASMLAAQGSPVAEMPSNAVAEQQAAAQAAMTPEQRQQAAANALLSQPVQADAQNPLGGMVGSLESQGNIAQAAGMSKAAQFGEDAKILADRNKANAIVQQQITDDQAQKQQLEQQKYDEFNKAIEAERSFQIDKNGAWHSASTGQKIAGVMGAIIGGLGAAVGSTPGHVMDNPALKVIQDTIKADVDAQYKQRENLQWQVGAKKQSLDTYRQMSGDAIQAKQMALAQGYRNAADQMEQVATKYGGPQAVLAAKDAAEKLRFQANGVIAQASSAQAAGLLAKQKAAQEQANKDREDMRKGQEISLGYYKENQANARTRVENINPDTGLPYKVEEARAALAAREADKVQKQKDADDKGQIGGVAAGFDPKTGEVKWDVVRQDDGKPLVIQDPDTRREIGVMVSAADSVNQKANRLAKEIKEWGGQTDIRKSPHYQDIMADYNDMFLAVHDAKGVKGFRPGTLEAMKEMASGVDPTSFIRDATPGIQRMKQNINEDVTNRLRRDAGYKGPDYAPVDTTDLGPPTKSDIEEHASAIQGSTLGVDATNQVNHNDADDQEWLDVMPPALRMGQFSPDAATSRALADKLANGISSPLVEQAVRAGLVPSQLKHFNALEAAASGRDPTARDQALSQLNDLANNGPNGAIRDYAAHLNASHLLSGIRSGESPPRGGTSARESP